TYLSHYTASARCFLAPNEPWFAREDSPVYLMGGFDLIAQPAAGTDTRWLWWHDPRRPAIAGIGQQTHCPVAVPTPGHWLGWWGAAGGASTSSLARLVFVDRRLYRGLALLARRCELRRGVLVARAAQPVDVILKVWMHEARHQLVASLGGRPVGPVVGQEQHAAEPTVRAFPQALEVANAIFWRADCGEPRLDQIVGGIPADVGWDDGKGGHFREVAPKIVEAEFHIPARLLAGLGHVREGNDAPFASVRRLAMGARGLLVNAPVAGVCLEGVVRRAADGEHADAVLAGGKGPGR